MKKLESIKLDRFKSTELTEMSKEAIFGGMTTYNISSKVVGDGTIIDASTSHDSDSVLGG